MMVPARPKHLLVPTLIAALAVAVGSSAATGVMHSSNASSAGDLYIQLCAQCHGRSGKGDGPRAAHLMTRLHSFADCEWMAMRSGATLFLAIKSGSAAVGMLPEMPPFDSKLDDEQITELIDYVKRFCLEKAPTGSER